MQEDVLFSEQHHIGWITLNRPNALNALNFGMFKALYTQLSAWQTDDNIHAVVIEASPARAFCAGGDVRWVYDMGQKNADTALELFWHEYRLNLLIAKLGKPYIALMDGLTIGGGVGVTLHGSHRVASERFAFCMPEAGIGLFPDIGASHLLSACPDGVGFYLGLTGARVNPNDSKRLELIDYTVSSDDFSLIRSQLLTADLSDQASEKVSDILSAYDVMCDSNQNALPFDFIKSCFVAPESLKAIFDALNQIDSDVAKATEKKLLTLSPLSLHVTLLQLTRAKGLDLAGCLAMDYDLVYHFLQGHDFYEGVRALLVDKDKSPQWAPRHWEEVSASTVLNYFKKPTGVHALW